MRTLSLLRRPKRAARTLHPRIPGRPPLESVVPTFAIRVGRPSARPFRSSLSHLDDGIRAVLARFGGQVRPVATVLLPEALHVVACGSPESVAGLARELGRILESAEVETVLAPDGGRAVEPVEPLRISVLRVSSLAGAAGTVLDLPQVRGLVGGGRWPYAHAGEA